MTTGPVKVDPCKGWSMILVGNGDVLTDQTAKEILAHNLNGVAQGCWTKPKKQ